MLSLQGTNLVDQIKVGVGADIVLQSLDVRAPLDEENIASFLTNQNNTIVEGFACNEYESFSFF